VFPAIKELLTAWKAKIADPHYMIFASVLQAGIDKLLKYYNRFNIKPCILMNLLKPIKLMHY